MAPWTWTNPRPVDEFYWLECELWDGSRLVRRGCVSWSATKGGPYSVSITYEAERGLGLY